MDKPKELKVKLPVQQHLQLHALKLMTGKNISDAVKEALDHYLGDLLGARDAGQDALTGTDAIASSEDEIADES